MKAFSIVLCLLAFFVMPGFAADIVDKKPAFTLAPLPFEYNGLEPVISAQTMQIHHGKHHQAYVDKLNAEVEKNQDLQGKTLEEILAHVSTYNSETRNNAGGHWNHSFFWQVMAPLDKTGTIAPDLRQAIEKKFGSVEKFMADFETAGIRRFGSGWVWLVVTSDNHLEIVSTPNQDNPLMDDAEVKGIPVLGNDIWEHAYYLDYQNKRGDYLHKWWDIVNWTRVSENYARAVKSQSGKL